MSVLALELKSFDGLPLHPLLVHIPVVLVPLALIFAIAAVVRAPWRSWALPVTAFLAAGSLAGVQFAMMSGEGLRSMNGEDNAIVQHHAELADQARPIVFLFFVVAFAAAFAQWWAGRTPDDAGAATDDAGDRPSPAAPTGTVQRGAALLVRFLVPLCALSIVTGALATAWVYRVGHTGAESVWKGGDSRHGDRGDGGGDRDRPPG